MRLVFTIALALAVVVPAGRATTEPDPIVSVDVALTPNAVTLSRSDARRGSYVDFHIRNTGTSRRIFSVAGRTASIPARATRRIAIFFSARGRYAYATRTASGRTIHGTFRVV